MRSKGGRDWVKRAGDPGVADSFEIDDGILGYKLVLTRVNGWVLERHNTALETCDVLEVFDGETTVAPVLSWVDGYDVTPELGTSRSWETKVRVLRQHCQALHEELAETRRHLYAIQAAQVMTAVDTTNA